MKTDIEIAQEAVMEPIKNVAARCGISEDDLELYGKYKAKISDEYINSVKDNEDGKLILVTAINPTPAGEGKTTISVGLGEAFGQLGKKAVIALREPSLGPCFGIKGGAAGGGQAGRRERIRSGKLFSSAGGGRKRGPAAFGLCTVLWGGIPAGAEAGRAVYHDHPIGKSSVRAEGGHLRKAVSQRGKAV